MATSTLGGAEVRQLQWIIVDYWLKVIDVCVLNGSSGDFTAMY